jgi:hypothetical protein
MVQPPNCTEHKDIQVAFTKSAEDPDCGPGRVLYCEPLHLVSGALLCTAHNNGGPADPKTSKRSRRAVLVRHIPPWVLSGARHGRGRVHGEGYLLDVLGVSGLC